jgi:hypothetical protein
MTESNLCEGCGALCCRKLIIEIEHLDVLREPRLLPIVIPASGNDFNENAWQNEYILAGGTTRPCKMLDGERCSIYPSRPNACVAFQPGGRHCNELREEAGLTPVVNPILIVDEDE